MAESRRILSVFVATTWGGSISEKKQTNRHRARQAVTGSLATPAPRETLKLPQARLNPRQDVLRAGVKRLRRALSTARVQDIE